MKNKKIIFAGMVVSAFVAVVLSANSAKASFWDLFKAGDDNTAAVASAATTTPTIKVVSPNGGEVWKAGTKKNIVFKGNLIKEPVTIAIQKPNSEGLVIGWSITSGNGKTSTYSWDIPTTIEQRNDYRIAIRYTNNPASNPNSAVSDESDKTFTIKSASSSSSKSSSSRSSKSSSSKSSSSKSSRSSATTTAYTLTVFKSGNGFISDGGRINCGAVCREKYWPGSEVKLTATPDGGYVFERFVPERECSSIYSGGFGFNDNKLTKQAFAYGPAENVVCVTIMNKNKGIAAHFKKIPSASSSSKSKSSSSRSSRSNSSASSVKATSTSY